MPKLKSIRNKGVVLFIVLATVLFVVLLANVILSVVSSQARLTHHQVSRIQAYYAAKAGMNWAFEMLRLGPTAGGWSPPAVDSSYNKKICRTGTAGVDGCTIVDGSFPIAIQSIDVTVFDKGAPGCSPPSGTPYCIDTSVNYTYTQ